MGHTMDTLDMMENNIWNETILWQNETRRMRRHANYPALEAGEPRLVRKLADQMRALPLEKVRQIRSGKKLKNPKSGAKTIFGIKFFILIF